MRPRQRFGRASLDDGQASPSDTSAAGADDASICWLTEVAPVPAPSRERAGLRDVLATLDLGITMACDPDGTIRHWSKGCERLYGWKPEEAVGQIPHLLLQTVFPMPLATIEAALETDGVWSGDLRHTTRDGRALIVTVRKVLRRDDAGVPIAVMEAIADVTAQREAERMLAETSSQLANAAKMEALGRLAGGMAHDFNNILQVLQSSLEMAVEADTFEERQRLLEVGTRLTARGSSITTRLLAFARQGALQASAVVPAELLARLVEMLSPVIGPSIDLTVDAPPGLPALFADCAQLETVLVNLVNNARDAMPHGGALSIRATAIAIPGDTIPSAELADGRYIGLSVIDEGIGIPEAALARIIEPFFNTKPGGKGTGLGLAMAHGFAKQSGGGLSIESRVGHGTTVSLWLPEATASVLATVATALETVATVATVGLTFVPPRRALSTRPRSPCAQPRRTVLLVEDEPVLRLILGRALERHGYLVTRAEGAAAALSQLAHGACPDAVVTDFAMPGTWNGLDLIRSVRERSAVTPIILITGDTSSVSASEFAAEQRAGNFILLRKPFTTGAFLERLALAIEGCGAKHLN